MKDPGKYKDELLRKNKELRQENDLLKTTLFDWGIADYQKQETKFQPTVDSHNSNPLDTKDGFWLLDEEGCLLEVNETYCRMSGYTEKELISMRATDLEASGSAEELTDRLQKVVLHGDDCFETFHRRKDGSLMDVEVSVKYRKFEGGRFIVFVRDITKNKQIENTLWKSAEKYRNLAENLNEVVFEADPYSTKTIYINKAIENIFGYTVKEWLENPVLWLNSIHPEDKERVLEDSREAMNTMKKLVLTYRIIRKDNAIRWVEERISWVKDEAGKIISVNGLVYDITRRKQAEEDLYISNEFNNTLLRTIPFGMDIVDKHGNILFLSENLKQFLGTEGLGKKCWELFCDDKSQCSGCPLQSGINIGETRILEIKGVFNKKIFEVSHSGMVFKGDKAVLEVFVDITNRKLAEIALHESERKYRSLVETAQELIWKCDSNGRFTYLNPAWEKTHGYKLDEMLGKSFSAFLPSEIYKRDLEEFARNLEGESASEYETNHITKDGKELTLLFNAIPLADQHGNLIGTQGTAIDITRQKQAEAELVSAKEKAEENDRLKSAFLANMSHEIRTPMNGILGFARLLQEPKLSGEEQQEYIRIIANSGVRMLNIINDIIDISKIESGQMKVGVQESNINEQIEYIYTFFKPEVERKGLQFSLRNSLSSKESIIKTDREKVFAILTNLVKNAIKFCDNGSIELGYVKKGSNLEFFVRDTGIGILQDRQQAIFERFIQADISDKRAFQGAGLGLTITKAYVEMLGGKIWLESEPGKGSTFYFTLPYITRLEEKVSVEEVGLGEGKETLNKKLKILIAEDDEISEKLITILVNPFRKEVLIANSGVEAVETCRNNPDIDLVLMDIQMPGLNGYEATRQIRQFNKDIIIIAQTAFGLIGDREKALEAGCNDYIAKPLDLNLLKKLIRDYFKMASR